VIAVAFLACAYKFNFPFVNFQLSGAESFKVGNFWHRLEAFGYGVREFNAIANADNIGILCVPADYFIANEAANNITGHAHFLGRVGYFIEDKKFFLCARNFHRIKDTEEPI
jgi:hypothetical protein